MSATQNFLTTVTGTFNQMTLPIQSGLLYTIKANIPVLLDANSNGFTLGLTFPAARRCSLLGVTFQGAAASAFAQTSINMVNTPATGTNIFVITSGTAAVRPIWLDITLECSGSGNLLFYGQAEVANATAKVVEGGNLIAWQVGPLTL